MTRLASIGIVPRGTYNFRGLKNGTVTIPLAQRIDTSAAHSLTIELWLHEGTFPDGSSVTFRAASDGYSPENPSEAVLQTNAADGTPIAAFVVKTEARLPLFQTIVVPAQHIGRLFALLLEVQGGEAGGPAFEMTVDLLLRESVELPQLEPIITSPVEDEVGSSASLARIARAAGDAAARAPKRYPRWKDYQA